MSSVDGASHIDHSNNESKVFVWLTCVYIVTWYLQLGSRLSILDAIRFEFVLGSCLSVCAIFKLLTDGVSATRLRAPIVLWVSVLGLYTLFSYDVERSWDVYFNRVIKFSMLALFLSAFVRSEWALKMVVAAFLLAMLKLGQEGVHGWLTGGLVWQNQGIMRLHGSTMMYRHPNSYSGMAVGCLPFIFYLFPIANRWQKPILLALLFCVGIIILYTGSRTGYVATVLLAIYFWREKLRVAWFKNFILGILLLLLVYGVAPDQYVERFISIYTLEEAEGASASKRLEILKDAWSVFTSYPFGVGVSAFPVVRMDLFGRFQDTHNLYLEVLTNTSLIGLFSFFWLLYRVVKECRKIQLDSESDFLVALAKAVEAFIYARLFLGMFGMDAYEIYWWFAAGLTISLSRISSGNNSIISKGRIYK